MMTESDFLRVAARVQIPQTMELIDAKGDSATLADVAQTSGVRGDDIIDELLMMLLGERDSAVVAYRAVVRDRG